MEIVLVLVVGAMCIACFMVGAKVGQTVSKGEDIQTPTVNPMTLYREHEQRKAEREEQKRIETIMRNVDNYDGTGGRQEDVPGR